MTHKKDVRIASIASAHIFLYGFVRGGAGFAVRPRTL
jgi:hypothetical protein